MEFLADVPAGELIQVLADFPASLDHVIDGVPLGGQTTRIKVINLSGRTVVITVGQHLLRDTPAARTWLAGRRHASGLTLLEYTGQYPSDTRTLQTDTDFFDAVVAAGRAHRRRVSGPRRPGPGTAQRAPNLGDLGSPSPAPGSAALRSRPRRTASVQGK